METPMRQFALRYKTSFTSLKWSPHAAGVFAVGCAANFAVVGTGCTQIKALYGSSIRTLAVLEEKDAVFDVSWYEQADQLLLIGSGNGDISLWTIGKSRAWTIPTQGEVYSVYCSYKTPLFIAGCQKGAVLIGDSMVGKILFIIPAHMKNCNQVMWHPTSEKVFASCGGDGLLKLWDHTLPKPNISSHRAHEADILSIDFNKYDEHIVTASIDKSIRIWDMRNLTVPVNILQHHRYPPKKVRSSPHFGWLLGSCSYDMNVHFYDLRDPVEPLKFKSAQHTYFVPAMDFSLYDNKLVASAGWDGRILVWDFDQLQPIIT